MAADVKALQQKAKPFLAEGVKINRMKEQARQESIRIDGLESNWRRKLNEAFGTDALEFSNVMCREFSGGHVYSPSTYRGVGHRHCVFCGTDDFDGY